MICPITDHHKWRPRKWTPPITDHPRSAHVSADQQTIIDLTIRGADLVARSALRSGHTKVRARLQRLGGKMASAEEEPPHGDGRPMNDEGEATHGSD